MPLSDMWVNIQAKYQMLFTILVIFLIFQLISCNHLSAELSSIIDNYKYVLIVILMYISGWAGSAHRNWPRPRKALQNRFMIPIPKA